MALNIVDRSFIDIQLQTDQILTITYVKTQNFVILNIFHQFDRNFWGTNSKIFNIDLNQISMAKQLSMTLNIVDSSFIDIQLQTDQILTITYVKTQNFVILKIFHQFGRNF